VPDPGKQNFWAIDM